MQDTPSICDSLVVVRSLFVFAPIVCRFLCFELIL